LKWVAAVVRHDWTPSKTAVLCGRHFVSSDFLDASYSTPGLKKKMLKKDAVPSFFSTENCENKEINTTFVESHLCSTTVPFSSILVPRVFFIVWSRDSTKINCPRGEWQSIKSHA
jgi:hypothetical protein